MPTRRQLIQKIELNSDQSSVTFSGIPQNYTDLKLIYSARSSTATATSYASILKMNGDSGNAIFRRFEGFQTSISTYTTNICYLDIIPGTTNTANNFNSVQVDIPNYTSNNYKSYKSISALSGNSTNYGSVDVIVGRWSSSSPVTSIVLVPSTGSYAANSTFYLYGITHVPIIRGGEEYVLDGFKYHKFTSTAALQVIEPGDVEYLVVAGGGSGGTNFGGGGGGGGVTNGRVKVSPSISNVVIGSGGAGSSSGNATGNSGSNSSFLSISSLGGGYGGNRNTLSGNGANGGSGGGGGYGSTGAGGSGTTNQGFSGGNASLSSRYGAGGGGGAGSAGSNGSTTTGGNGGQAILVWGQYYSGGGGGGAGDSPNTGGIAGINGSNGATDTNPSTNASINTGGGSGGTSSNTSTSISGNGGSGIVIIRYPYDGN